MTELMIEIYRSVVGFWELPVLLAGQIFGIIYLLIAIKNVAEEYIQTGKICAEKSEQSFWEEIKTPYVMFGLVGYGLISFGSVIALMAWPITVAFLVLSAVIGIPVHRKRKRVLFMQRLKGTDGETE